MNGCFLNSTEIIVLRGQARPVPFSTTNELQTADVLRNVFDVRGFALGEVKTFNRARVDGGRKFDLKPC